MHGEPRQAFFDREPFAGQKAGAHPIRGAPKPQVQAGGLHQRVGDRVATGGGENLAPGDHFAQALRGHDARQTRIAGRGHGAGLPQQGGRLGAA